MMTVKPVDALTAPAAGAVNEDVHGHSGTATAGAAWVIDGATGVAEETLIADADSDARWYATALDAAFARRGPGCQAAVADTVRAALTEVAQRFRAAVGDRPVPDHARPSAAAVWLRWCPTAPRLELAALGDCVAILKPDGAPAQRIGRQGDDSADERVNAAVRAFQAAGVTDPAEIRRRLTDRLRATRATMNRPGGYWVFGVEPGAADHLDRIELAPTLPAWLLLASDGLYRLVDTYRAVDHHQLVAEAAATGLAPLYRTLRRIERADPACLRHPRLKPEDDATGVLLRLESVTSQ